jgi:hypothetical protein
MKKENIKKNVLSILIFFIVIIIIILSMIASSDWIHRAPDNAFVFANKNTMTYFSPPLLIEDKRDFIIQSSYRFVIENGYEPGGIYSKRLNDVVKGDSKWNESVVYVNLKDKKYYTHSDLNENNYELILRPMTILEARNNRYRADEIHEKMGGFIQTGDSYAWDKLMIKVGIKKSRWDKQGNWNW